MDMNKFQSCLCEYCVNVEFKLEALKKTCNAEGLSELKIENKLDCLKMTLCPTEQHFNDKQCYERNCAHCGEEYIAPHFQSLVDGCGEKTIKWKRWELCSVGSAGIKAKRQILVEKEGNVLDLLKQLTDELKPLAKHIFTATWQRQQYQRLRSNVPENCVVTVMDFAENYRCVNQDEVQSAYYNYQQATLFPCVAHYQCPDCSDGIVEESIVFLSPDLKHDSHAAREFIREMDKHLKKNVSFSHGIQYSDGSAAQFKSKTPFQHISEESDHFVERYYFGSRHGKSSCDALGGLLKSQATKYVRSRRGTIPDAEALYDFCKNNLAEEQKEKCLHKKRTFFYIEEIHRDSESAKLLTLPGTRSLHNVKSVSPGIVKVRTLACLCPGCRSEDDCAKCENEHVVGKWKTCSIKGRKNDREAKQSGEDEFDERKSPSKTEAKPKRRLKRKVQNVKDSKNKKKSDPQKFNGIDDKSSGQSRNTVETVKENKNNEGSYHGGETIKQKLVFKAAKLIHFLTVPHSVIYK